MTDRLKPRTLYPLKVLAEHFGITRYALKNACQRYRATGGLWGLRSKKMERDWFAYPTDTEQYLRRRGSHKFPENFVSYLKPEEDQIPR